VFLVGALAAWLAGEPSGQLVVVAVFLGGGFLVAWAAAAAR
jgi:hypothetical protein